MNELLIRNMKKEITKSKETNNYENLYRYAYSDNFIIRYIFMKLLLTIGNNKDIYELYEDNITYYFNRYDDDGNVIGLMPYRFVKEIGEKAMFKDYTIYKQILNYIINNYIKTPEEFTKELSI